MRVAFLVSGRGALFRAALRDAGALGIAPALLILERKAAPDLDALASGSGIRVVRLDPSSPTAFQAAIDVALAEADPDLVVLTFDRILPPSTVRRFPGRIINVHPALLPAFPGTRAIERLLASGARFGGATIHVVTDHLDAGPIIAQAVVPTIPGEPADQYGLRMYDLLEPMFLQVLAWYADGRVRENEDGTILIDGAVYGASPISPTLGV